MLCTLKCNGTVMQERSFPKHLGWGKGFLPDGHIGLGRGAGWFGFQQFKDLADKLYYKVHFLANGLIANNYFLMAVPWLTTTLQLKAANGFKDPTAKYRKRQLFSISPWFSCSDVETTLVEGSHVGGGKLNSGEGKRKRKFINNW